MVSLFYGMTCCRSKHGIWESIRRTYHGVCRPSDFPLILTFLFSSSEIREGFSRGTLESYRARKLDGGIHRSIDRDCWRLARSVLRSFTVHVTRVLYNYLWYYYSRRGSIESTVVAAQLEKEQRLWKRKEGTRR